jgi:hypothetical protein
VREQKENLRFGYFRFVLDLYSTFRLDQESTVQLANVLMNIDYRVGHKTRQHGIDIKCLEARLLLEHSPLVSKIEIKDDRVYLIGFDSARAYERIITVPISTLHIQRAV